MDDFLKMPGRRVPDWLDTPGRGKTVWKPSDKVKIEFEAHPYNPLAGSHKQAPHWHLYCPGDGHQFFAPGDPIPGY